jgi:aryl-alcohol dehydrogenase-like predicted oxidoreductase
VAQLEAARRIVTVVSVQNEYNLRERTSDDVLAACAKLGIAFLPWYPLGGGRGLLASKVKRVAERHGVSASQVALAWLLGRSPTVLPIPGTSSIEHLEDNLRAAELALGAEDLKELDSRH